MCNNDSGLEEWKTINTSIKIGDGKLLKATKIGKMKLVIKPLNEKDPIVVLSDVQYVPDLTVNLFSITKALDIG